MVLDVDLEEESASKFFRKSFEQWSDRIVWLGPLGPEFDDGNRVGSHLRKFEEVAVARHVSQLRCIGMQRGGGKRPYNLIKSVDGPN